jgi:UDP-3-O-[3-hydroxymyristoyl] glucosamine N-acyltransferase
MAQVGVAGSTRIGDGVVLAGQVGLAGHISIGDGVRLAGQAGAFRDIPPGAGDWGGCPASPNRDWLRSTAVLHRIAPLVRELEAMVRERRADA